MGYPAENRAAHLLGEARAADEGNGHGNGGSGKRACDSPGCAARHAGKESRRRRSRTVARGGGGQGAVGTAGGFRTGREQGPDRWHPG